MHSADAYADSCAASSVGIGGATLGYTDIPIRSADVLDASDARLGNVSGLGSLQDIPIFDADDLDASDSTMHGSRSGELASRLRTTEPFYGGHGGFSFALVSSFAARRAGFFSSSRPPEIGERVVCFRREQWQRQGMVTEVETKVSNGIAGFQAGKESAWVIIEDDVGETFESWAVYLAPVNDMEYSSLCTTDEFLSSHFHRLYFQAANADRACMDVSDQEARASLQVWLKNVVDADGEPVVVPDEVQEELLRLFDEQSDPSIHIYSKHTKLGPKTSLNKGGDYSVYYLALNNTLNHDECSTIELAFPLLRHMISRLLFNGDMKELHPGGRVWKGDTDPPVPMNVRKLKDALKSQAVVRFRQFQSTTSNETVANRFKKRADSRGFLWIIDIHNNFWGARDIRGVAWKGHEAETLFPPYAAFLVQSVDADCCHLVSVDRDSDLSSLVCDLDGSIESTLLDSHFDLSRTLT